MSLISVTNVEILNNPAKFDEPFQFEISFECIAPVKEELEWKLVYVGSAEDDQYDQELDSVLVGPIIVGKNKFVFEAAAPDPTLIPSKDIMEVTVLLLTCAYKEKEFIRIGYYVMNDYDPSEVALVQARDAWLTHSAQLQHDYATQVNAIKAEEERLRAAGQFIEALPLPPQPVIPPAPAVDISKLTRNILADKPRVTRFQIPWDEADPTQEFAMDAADEAAAAEEAKVGDMTDAAAPVDDDDGEEDDEEDEDMELDEEEGEGEEEGEDGEEDDEVGGEDGEEDAAATSANAQSMKV